MKPLMGTRALRRGCSVIWPVFDELGEVSYASGILKADWPARKGDEGGPAYGPDWKGGGRGGATMSKALNQRGGLQYSMRFETYFAYDRADQRADAGEELYNSESVWRIHLILNTTLTSGSCLRSTQVLCCPRTVRARRWWW